jgi:polysaccharide pyruvyl transferase CsaB
MGKPAKHIVVCGYTGFNNFGDELLAATLIQQLNAVATDANQPLTITVLTHNPAQSKAWLAPYQGALTLRTAHRFNLLALLPLLTKAHGLIVGGGGLFQDVSGLSSPVYYGGLMVLAQLLGCNVACWSQGIGPLNSALGSWITKQALTLASPIGVRDANSAHWVRTHVGHAPAPSTDAVWGFSAKNDALENPALTTQQPEEAFILGLSLRPTPSWSNQQVDTLLNLLNQQLSIYPAVVVKLLNAHPSLDIKPLTRAAESMQQQHPNLSVEWVDCADISTAIHQCQQVVAMRYHVLMAAATAGKSTLGLIYDPKVADLCQKVSLPAIHPNHLPNKTTLPALWKQCANPAAIQHQQQLSLKNTDNIAAFLTKLS